MSGGRFRKETKHLKDGSEITITAQNGKVQFTIKGVVKTYLGKEGKVDDLGEMIVDGKPVTPNDDRLVPNVKLSIVSEDQTHQWQSLAAEKGQNVEIDDLGNVKFSPKM